MVLVLNRAGFFALYYKKAVRFWRAKDKNLIRKKNLRSPQSSSFFPFLSLLEQI